MKNFGVTDLVLVKPCRLGTEARQRAMRGFEILGHFLEAFVDTGCVEVAFLEFTLNIVQHLRCLLRVDLAFLWPSLDPPDPAAKPGPTEQVPPIDRIFITIQPPSIGLTPSERMTVAKSASDAKSRGRRTTSGRRSGSA